jgi:uncharacterized protein
MNPSTRIQTLDALRGAALLGILVMNILWFGMPEKTVEDLGIRGEYSGMNYYAWWVVEVFFHGTMRGMFSMLFGASALLILEKYTPKSDPGSAAEYYFRRLLALFLFGLFNAYILLWPGDILYTYALAGMFVFPLFRLSPKRMITVACIIMLLFSLKSSWQKQHPMRLKEAADAAISAGTRASEDQKADLDAWKSFEMKQSMAHKRAEADGQAACTLGDFGTLFFFNAGVVYFLETEFTYDFFFLDAFCFMLIGMALFRLGILSGTKSRRFYLLLSLAGFVIGFPIYLHAASIKVESQFNPYLIALKEPFNLEQFGRLGLTLGYIGLLNLIFKLPITSRLSGLLAPVGRMAFTNYLMQSIICGLIFSGFAFGMFNKLQRFELYYVVVAVWIFQLVFSHLWMRSFTTGPFEWLWRSAAKWEWQRFERVSKM